MSQVLPSNFNAFYTAHAWQEIPNCPGRYTLHPQKTLSLNVQEFIFDTDGSLEQKIKDWPIENWLIRWDKGEVVRDILWAVRLENDCGIISYEHRTGGFLHTLNSASGFERKLKALKIYDQVYK